jgi:D-alanyl-lipoteichoic acid acyltransferase DltB (MBOAT superfamily)
MSLSKWIRDYIYIPLGGNRGSPARTSFNLLFAMTLCGLWHGANWTFVAWGALNGLYLIAHRVFRAQTRGMTELHTLMASVPGTAMRIAMTFIAFTLGMVVFRSPSFGTVAKMFERLFVPQDGAGCPIPSAPFWMLAGIVFAAHVLAVVPDRWGAWNRLPPALRGLALAGLVAGALILVPVTTSMFIYFQF